MYCNLMVQSCSVCLYLHFFFLSVGGYTERPAVSLLNYNIIKVFIYFVVIVIDWEISCSPGSCGSQTHTHMKWKECNLISIYSQDCIVWLSLYWGNSWAKQLYLQYIIPKYGILRFNSFNITTKRGVYFTVRSLGSIRNIWKWD